MVSAYQVLPCCYLAQPACKWPNDTRHFVLAYTAMADITLPAQQSTTTTQNTGSEEQEATPSSFFKNKQLVGSDILHLLTLQPRLSWCLGSL